MQAIFNLQRGMFRSIKTEAYVRGGDSVSRSVLRAEQNEVTDLMVLSDG